MATLSPQRSIELLFPEVVMKKIATNVATAAGVVFVGFLGYVVLTALPDIRRYIRISTM